MASTSISKWDKHFNRFDIDNYVNPFVPRNRFYILPSYISWWFGYRARNAKPQKALPTPYVWLSACIGGFIGIAIITNVYRALPLLGGHQVPLVIASFGAAAILEYNTIESPLAQPRNLIVGHFLSALIGVAITKGFERLSPERFEELRWLAGSISVGIASAVMGMTKTIHPPAGATALLASTSPEVTVLGWWLLPLILLAACLMAASALIINNITRRWPAYWWTPADLSTKKPDIEHLAQAEQDAKSISETSEDNSISKENTMHHEGTPSRSSSALTHIKAHGRETNRELQILIDPQGIVIPDWMEVQSYEEEFLEMFLQRIRNRAGVLA